LVAEATLRGNWTGYKLNGDYLISPKPEGEVIALKKAPKFEVGLELDLTRRRIISYADAVTAFGQSE
jgi:hypothetical protein